jgi:hypothetical protein
VHRRHRRNVDPAREAYWCHCWAAVLTGLSNSHHFGLENDSPFEVRMLAIAFLNRAKDLGGFEDSEAVHKDAVGELIGDAGKLTCTGALFEVMKGLLRDQAQKDPALMQIYQTLIPPAW